MCLTHTSLRMRHITSHRQKFFSAYYRDRVRFGAFRGRGLRRCGPSATGRPQVRPAPGFLTGRQGAELRAGAASRMGNRPWTAFLSVGLAGFEPTPPSPPVRCATELRHSPSASASRAATSTRLAHGGDRPPIGWSLALATLLDPHVHAHRRAVEAERLPQATLEEAPVAGLQKARG